MGTKFVIGSCVLGLLALLVYFVVTSGFANRPTSMPSAQNKLFNEILDEPLRNFYINTSHNSFLEDNQVGGVSSSKNTLSALYSGARCIELDLRFPKDKSQQAANSPVVAHKGADFKTSMFEDHCVAIRDFAFLLTNDPLIIYLEIDDADKKGYMQNIANLIKQYWGDRLYEYTFNKYAPWDGLGEEHFKKYLPNAPLRSLLGKICIVVNYFNMSKGDGLKHRDEILGPYIHATTDEPSTGWFENGFVMSGQGSNDRVRNRFFNLTRVYPANVFRSDNYDMVPFVENGYSLIAFNLSFRDEYLPKHKAMFANENIIPKFWYVNADNNWAKATVYSNSGGNHVWYKNLKKSGGKNVRQRIVQGCAYSNNCSWVVNDWNLTMQNDGNLVMYKNGKVDWHSKTFGNPNAVLVMQNDGNLVIYNQNGGAIWSSGTNGFNTTGVEMQVDGRLLMISAGSSSNKTIKK